MTKHNLTPHLNRNERRIAQREAKSKVARGLDPSQLDPYIVIELAQQIYRRIETARNSRNIDAPVEYLLSKIDLTLDGMRDVEVACGKGCSHCCNVWVSVTAPEALFIAKQVANGATTHAVTAAHLATKDFSHSERPNHPVPCPLLKDNLCSVYDIRPLFCRLAASGDAEICRRAYNNITDENIPTPAMYIFGRETYSLALAAALKRAGLPHVCYEFNSALHRALTVPNAEREWLSGVDIFEEVLKENNDPFDIPLNQMLYEAAFG